MLNKRSMVLVAAVTAIFTQVGASGGELGFVGTFEHVCLSAKGDYDTVLRTMSNLSGWTEGQHPGGAHILRVKAWAFTDASPQAVAAAFKLKEGMALGVAASLLKSSVGEPVPDCSVHGVIDPRVVRDALTDLGFSAVGGDLWVSTNEDRLEIRMTTEQRPGLTNVHLLKVQ